MSNVNKFDFSVEQLKNGSMLCSIAHAIMMSEMPGLSFMSDWEDSNYLLRDGCGNDGAVTFGEKYCVGAFRNHESERIDDFKTASEYLKNTPPEVMEIAETATFQYLIDSVEYIENLPEGIEEDDYIAVITTAFWGDESGVYSNDTFEDFMENGGYDLLRTQLKDYDEAIKSMIESKGMKPQQVELLKSIYTRKIAEPDKQIILTPEEIEMIGPFDEEGESKNFEEYAKKMCVESFEQLNIIVNLD